MAVNIKPLFFWTESVKKIIWDPFWWVIIMLIIFWVPFLRVWWWVFLPLFLSMQLKTLYLWWLNWDFDYAKAKWVMLEITPPKEVLIPFKAMEDVFSMIWPLWDHPVFREIWCDGELDDAPYWCSFELASIEGKIHFYLRCLQAHRAIIEPALYSHYPDLEIKEVSDYTKLVPQNVPNEEWDIYGEDFILAKENAFPIKTYEKFFEPQGEKISAEEKRIDPIISLLESLAKLGSGEHYWLQFILMPILSPDTDYVNFKKEGENIVNKISKRPEKKETTLFEELGSIVSDLIMGPKKEGSGESAKYSWISAAKEESGEREMVLTPGEREIITEVENKLKKPLFRTTIRGVYIAKRENFRPPNGKIARSYFPHFATSNMNYLRFSGDTRTKVHNIMRKRRVFLRARRIIRNAYLRFPPKFPDRKSVCAILSTEELATLFHFPLRVSGMVSPSMAKVESKKGGPPPNLPVE
ncbi:MAG: hypothetical protein AAB352_03340 [Patescibacteria group bacterium]